MQPAPLSSSPPPPFQRCFASPEPWGGSARASKREQEAFIGNQAGGRVFLFLETDDLDRDYALYRARGVRFVRNPATHAYGSVAVFEDLYGNLWDLVQFA